LFIIEHITRQKGGFPQHIHPHQDEWFYVIEGEFLFEVGHDRVTLRTGGSITPPGIPQYMHPVVALLTAGVEMDVLGIDYTSFTDSDRNTVVQAFPRIAHFKEDILQAFYDGIKHRPETTFGNVKADVFADKDPDFRRGNFCSVIRDSSWRS
jgi:Cupin domain